MGTAGQIKLVHAEDFMNHKHFEVEFGYVILSPIMLLRKLATVQICIMCAPISMCMMKMDCTAHPLVQAAPELHLGRERVGEERDAAVPASVPGRGPAQDGARADHQGPHPRRRHQRARPRHRLEHREQLTHPLLLVYHVQQHCPQCIHLGHHSRSCDASRRGWVQPMTASEAIRNTSAGMGQAHASVISAKGCVH